MQPFFGLFNLGGFEIVLILALVLILFGSKKLPDLAKGLGQGIFEFRKAIDDEATEAGRSLGGIYGKAAAEALTPDNQVSELYDPAVLENDSEPRKCPNRFTKIFINLFQRIRRLFRLNHRT
jgi:twin arginine-targeting protein translocase, TatA/E family